MRSLGYSKSLMVAMMLVLIFVTACSKKNTDIEPGAIEDSPKPTATEEVKQVDPMGKYDPPIRVTMAKPVNPNSVIKDGQTEDDNVWRKAYEELGIDLNYTWTADAAQYNNKMNLTIASGDFPDVYQVNASQLKQLVENDQVEDLTEAYEQYATPLTKKILGDDGGLAISSGTVDGKLRGIPATQPSVQTQPFLWVRTDWLSKLNLPEPKTMEDVLNISNAFATQDPDGNNKQDTTGLSVSPNLWGTLSSLDGFFNGYHAYPNIWVKDASGQLVYGGTLPEVKTALTKLQLMYKAGEIEKEFAVDGNKVTEAITSGKNGLTYGPWWIPIWPLQSGKTLDPAMEWKAYPIVSGDNQPAMAQNTFYVTGYYVVKKGASNPEVLIKLFNVWFEKMYGESADYLTYGTKKDTSTVYWFSAVMAWPPNAKSNDRGDHIMEALNNNDPAKLNAEEKSYYDNILEYRNGNIAYWYMDGLYGSFSAWPAWHEYNDNNRVMQDAYYGAPTPTMAEKKASLDKMQNEGIIKIIMGAAPVDDYDNIIASWKKLGGDQITKEVNEWYNSQK